MDKKSVACIFQKIDPKLFLILCLLFSITISGIQILRMKGEPLRWMMFKEGSDIFMDYYNHVGYARTANDIFFQSEEAVSTPFTYLFYRSINSVSRVKEGELYQKTYFQRGRLYRLDPASMLTLMLINIVSGILFYFCVNRIKRGSDFENLLLTLLLLLSNVFLFAVLERGALLFTVIAFLLLWLSMKDSKRGWQREVAALALALSIVCRPYCAVFGFLYLKESRYKEAARIFFYSVAFSLFPLLFLGGMQGFCRWIENQYVLHSHCYNFLNTIPSFLMFYGRAFEMSHPFLLPICCGIGLAYFCLALWLATRLESEWKSLFLLVSTAILVPYWSGSYMMALYVLPLILFLRDYQKENRILCWCYTILFLGLFCSNVFRFSGLFLIYQECSFAGIRYLASYLFVLLLIGEALVNPRSTPCPASFPQPCEIVVETREENIK